MSHNTSTLVESSAPSVTALDEILSKIKQCHQTATDIHEIADRACGIRGEAGAAKPAPVPSGLLDEILDSISALNERLNGAYQRLARVA